MSMSLFYHFCRMSQSEWLSEKCCSVIGWFTCHHGESLQGFVSSPEQCYSVYMGKWHNVHSSSQLPLICSPVTNGTAIIAIEPLTFALEPRAIFSMHLRCIMAIKAAVTCTICPLTALRNPQ